MEAVPNSGHQNLRKPSKGRRKIPIQKVENANSRNVCFSKRKAGIFRKSVELSALCGVEIAVIIFSEAEKVFSFGVPGVDTLIDQYLGLANHLNTGSSSSSQSQMVQVLEGQECFRSMAMNEELRKALEMAESNRRSPLIDNNKEGFWWETPIESMGKEELEGYMKSIEELKKNVVNRIETISTDLKTVSDESGIINQFIDNQNDYYSLCESGFSTDQFFSF
ncbi:Agamous-like MADS-box protein AGL61 [Euphorbia peplus]|nr:Agamous-like MADS-box protein AGL61 [Euphorbia peplus]